MFNAIQSFFGYILGFIMWAIYKVIPYYGVALFVFTLITRVIQFPIAIKQQKSSAKSTMLQPQLQAIQEQYKDDREKQAEATQKFYAEKGYNPMSGCLPMLIQFPILYGLIDVVYKPLTHILHIGKDTLELFKNALTAGGIEPQHANMVQLQITDLVKSGSKIFSGIDSSILDKITKLNYSFLGMNLILKPETSMFSIANFNPVILIPILSGVTALLSSLFSMRSMPTPDGKQGGGGAMKGMMLMMPLMSVWIAFTVPAGVGLYWIYSNIFMVIQSWYMNKKYNPKELAEKAKEEQERLQQEAKLKDKEERDEAKRLYKEGKLDEADIEKALSQKEINRRRLSEARKRDAEQYGEEYIEVTDDDLR